MSGSGYLFQNEAPEAGDRFDALAALFDPWSVRQLERLGVEKGWRCLEVGAGGGTVAAWLAEHVGTSGHVLATDLDVRWLESRLRMANVEVRRHDVVVDPLPERSFDLIHERLVLIHIPERESVLHRLVSALRPGGWLVTEDFDVEAVTNAWVDPSSDPDDLQNRIVRGFQALLRQRGADQAFGLKLPKLLRGAGLEQVGAVGYQVIEGGDATRGLLRANVVQSAEQLIAQQLVSQAEIEEFLGRLDAGAVDPSTPLLVSAWGRRPGMSPD